MLKIQQSSKT